MAALVRSAGCGYIVMHSPVANAGDFADYAGGIVPCVQAFFDEMLERLVSAGIPTERLCLDPGFGFGKDTGQNLTLLRELDRLDTHGVCFLSALSRKRFVRGISDSPPEDCDAATAAGCVISIQKGANMLRVHNVVDCARAARFADAIYR